MKCLRCGKIHPDDVKVCKECGFSFEAFKQYKKVKEKEDPEIDPKQKAALIDNPLLTFIFGLLSVMLPIYIFSFLTFYMYKKPSKVKLETLRNFGNVLAYIGIAISIFMTVYLIWGLLD